MLSFASDQGIYCIEWNRGRALSSSCNWLLGVGPKAHPIESDPSRPYFCARVGARLCERQGKG
jgi:hypothetical protein